MISTSRLSAIRHCARLSRFVLLASVLGSLASGMGCVSAATPRAVDGSWEHQMRSGAEQVHGGSMAEAAGSYRRALELAVQQPHQPSRIAYSAWHLGDVCFQSPDVCPPGAARQRTRVSYEVFGVVYGPEHPVVIPILLRLAEIQALDGDPATAQALVEQADMITARTFPESHFMRIRSDGHRPAADLDPQELLRILAEVDLLGG